MKQIEKSYLQHFDVDQGRAYGSIIDVSLRAVTDDYDKWVNDDVEFVSPTEETFDEIKFIMNNGKSFVICADDAMADGYALLWSEDTDETFIDINTK